MNLSSMKTEIYQKEGKDSKRNVLLDEYHTAAKKSHIHIHYITNSGNEQVYYIHCVMKHNIHHYEWN